MDLITVVELSKPSGMMQNWPQPYEITVAPAPGDYMPELPFLHKEDGITLKDGTAYLIAIARQVAVKTTGGTQWRWVYQATKEKANDDEFGDWGI